MVYNGSTPESVETSREAAESLEPTAESIRQRMYNEYLFVHPDGITDDEMQTQLVLSGNTQRPRRRELMKAGLVVATPLRRATQTGRAAVVWVAVNADFPYESGDWNNETD